MRKLLIFLPLLLTGCGGDTESTVQLQTVQAAPTPGSTIEVAGDVWTSRLSGLPFVLNDVVFDGAEFVAVGGNGAILKSADGIDWIQIESGTDADLSAVGFLESDIVAVGRDATVLLSTNNGQDWTVKHSTGGIALYAVVMSPWQIVAGGMNQSTGDAVLMISADRGETWSMARSLPQTGHFVTDLIYANGVYVAATDVFDPDSDARVLVSVDGDDWHDVILRDDVAASYAILYDGSQFIAAGSEGTLFASSDGYQWTEVPTPIKDVDYHSAAWTGSQLFVAGGITWWYWWGGTPPDFERDVGLASSDGGVSWEVFGIDGYYQSNGMAWGNRHLVSVGQTTPASVEGAIYTSE